MAHASSIQSFGLNAFPQPHSVGGDANLGYLIPIMWDDVPFGSTIENNIDLFTRSSALIDPAFLDCDISIGHYFCSYESIDPLFKIRARNFKRTSSEVEIPQIRIPLQDLYPTVEGAARTISKDVSYGSLFDRLGLSLPEQVKNPVATTTPVYFNAYPFFAYHTICDWFFTSRHVQNCYRMQEAILQAFQDNPDGNYFSLSQIDTAYGKVDTRFGMANTASAAKYSILDLRSCNFEPDYFTTARPQAGSSDVFMPGTDENPSDATIRNLLDAQLLQKIADMLYRGGYSMHDLVSTLYGYNLDDSVTETPIYLGGVTRPLQVSTVTQTSVGSDASPLGTQAGTAQGYANGSNHFRYTARRAGIYMALLWIRPKVYYTSGINPKIMNRYFGDFLIPQLADASNAPIYQGELTGNLMDFSTVAGNTPIVFGYKDRYEEYRTKVNRATGTLRSTRQSWLNTRNFSKSIGSSTLAVTPDFLSMIDQANYYPWVVTDPSEPHFFFRAFNDYKQVNLLPARSQPYIW